MSAIPLKYAKKNGVPVTIAHSHSKSQDKDIKYPIKLLAKDLSLNTQIIYFLVEKKQEIGCLVVKI